MSRKHRDCNNVHLAQRGDRGVKGMHKPLFCPVWGQCVPALSEDVCECFGMRNGPMKARRVEGGGEHE